MEIHTVEAFMEPKTSGYEFIAPDAFALGTKYDNSFAHEGAAPSYETLFEGKDTHTQTHTQQTHTHTHTHARTRTQTQTIHRKNGHRQGFVSSW